MIISHDIRKPVVSMIQMVGRINEKENLIFAMKENLYSLLSGLDNILFWSKNQTESNLKTDRKNLDINELIDENIEFCDAEAKLRNILVINKIDKEYVAFADKEMLNICIRNILSNAIKYSSNNTEVVIDAEEKDNELKISVTDFGPGFENENNIKGLGIGLKVARKYIEMNNGKITINSSKQGSIVILSMPVS
jgi:signal transduction histidine kinase